MIQRLMCAIVWVSLLLVQAAYGAETRSNKPVSPKLSSGTGPAISIYIQSGLISEYKFDAKQSMTEIDTP